MILYSFTRIALKNSNRQILNIKWKRVDEQKTSFCKNFSSKMHALMFWKKTRIVYYKMQTFSTVHHKAMRFKSNFGTRKETEKRISRMDLQTLTSSYENKNISSAEYQWIWGHFKKQTASSRVPAKLPTFMPMRLVYSSAFG